MVDINLRNNRIFVILFFLFRTKRGERVAEITRLANDVKSSKKRNAKYLTKTKKIMIKKSQRRRQNKPRRSQVRTGASSSKNTWLRERNSS